jgi:hypothetical protein
LVLAFVDEIDSSVSSVTVIRPVVSEQKAGSSEQSTLASGRIVGVGAVVAVG